MKTLAIILIIAALGFGTWKAIETKPDASIPPATITDETTTPTSTNSDFASAISGKQIDNDTVTVAFTGFGPGKEHHGSFSDIGSNLSLSENGNVAGTLTVGMDSLSTDTEAVTKHLKTADFFDAAKYPTATFTVTEDLTASTCGGDTVRCKAPHLYGNFTIHGVTKGVSFPVTRTASAYTTTFTLSLKDFGIDQTFANETIELTVTAPLK